MEEKPDWIVAAMQGHTQGTLADVQAKGFSARDYDMRESGDDYWAKSEVQDAFGKDKDSFDTFFAQNKQKYLAMRKGEFDTTNFTLPPVTRAAARNNYETPPIRLGKTNPDPWGRAYGADMSDGGYSAKQRGWRETAINNGVRLKDGSYIKTDDFKSPTKFAVDENGAFKLDKNGSPYLSPIESGEELRSNEEVYNPIANSFGAYGHDYNMSQLLTSLPKNAINFLVDTTDALAEFPKAALAFGGQEKGDAAYDAISDFQTATRGFYIPKTERGAEGFFTAESLSDVSQQVVFQLASMFVAGGAATSTARMLGATAATAAKTGSIAGRMLMTGMSAGPIAKVARDYNLSPREAGLLLAATTAAFYPLSSLSESVLKGVGVSNSQAAIADAVRNEGIKIVKEGFSKSAMKSGIMNMRSTLKDFMYNAEKSQVGAIAASAVNESVEEVAEQGIDLGIRNLYNFYNDTIDQDSSAAKWLGTKSNNQFMFDWTEEAKNLGYAAVGGAIGGTVAGKIFQSMGYHNMPQYKDLHDSVMDGQEQPLHSFINNMEQQQRLAPSWLDNDGKLTKDTSLSQNAMAANILRGTVDYLVQARDAAGITDLKKNNEEKAKTYSDLIKMSSVGGDAANLHRSILELNAKLDQMKQSPTASPEETKLIQEELDIRQQQLYRIVKGEFVNDYLSEALYNVNSDGSKLPFNPRTFLDGKSFVNLTKTVPSLYKALQSEHTNTMQSLKETDEAATLLTPDGISQRGKDRLHKESEDVYKDALKQLNSLPPETLAQVDTQLAGMETGVSLASEEDDRPEFVASLYAMKDQLPPEVQPLADLLNASHVGLQKAQNLPVVQEPEPPTLASQFLNMVEPVKTTTGPIYNNSAISIRKKLDDELATRKDMNKAGVSLYSNSPALKQIINSVGSRLAQVSSLPSVASVINSKRMGDGDVLLPELSSKEEEDTISKLNDYMKEVQALYKESEENTNSSAAAVRRAVTALLNDQAELMVGVSDQTSATQYKGLAELAKAYYPQMTKALEAQDIDGAILAQKEFEKAAFEQFSESKEDILGLFNDRISLATLEAGNHDNYINVHNYLRGILSLSAVDFWNGYLGVLANSNPTGKVASDEQRLLVKRTVQSLMAGAFDPKFYDFPSYTSPKGYKFPMNHNYSAFVEGEGGTGKSSQIIPLIAGVIQKLEGGETFFTSYKDNRGKKISDLISTVRGYFSTGASTSGIAINPSNLDIISFLNSPLAVSKVNLIVFDEATLLTSNQLAEIQLKIMEINNLRKGQVPPLKILYTGDTNQNPIDVDKTNPDRSPDGIYNRSKHILDKIGPLTFSFRQSNQQLKLLSNMVKQGQFIAGKSQPVQFEFNDKNEGVRVIHDQTQFYKTAKGLIDAIKAAGSLDRAVYITDKPQTELPADINLSGITVLSSEEAQSEEWDTVFIDFKDKNLYVDKRTNLVNKKAMYTAITRARKMVMLSSPDSQPFFSKRGQVAMITPLSAADVSRDQETQRVKDLLGNDFSSTSTNKINYSDVSYTIANSDPLFPTKGGQTSASTTSTSTAQPSTTNVSKEEPASAPVQDISPEIKQAITNLVAKVTSGDTTPLTSEERTIQEQFPQEVEKEAIQARNPDVVVTEMGALPLSTLSVTDIPSAIAEQINLINKKDTVGLAMFYTSGEEGELGSNFDLKRKIMTSPKVRAGTNLFLAIEKIGSPGYRNIVRNDPTRAGAYATFIEAEFEGKKVIMGVLPSHNIDDPTFNIDKIIRDQGIMAGRASVRIPINSSLLAMAGNTAPFVVSSDKGAKSLSELSYQSPGINFGRIGILTEDLPSKTGKAPILKGEPFVPVSFMLTKEEIDSELSRNIRNNQITLIPLRSAKLPFEEIESILTRLLNEEGKMSFSGESATIYDSMFGHLGDTRTEPGKVATNNKKNLLGIAFRDILKTVNPDTDSTYYEFIQRRALAEANPETAEALQIAENEVPGSTQSISNAKYFMKDYLERKASGKPYSLFQRAIADLKKHPQFAQGFDFDPQLSKGSSVSPAFGFAKPMQRHNYDSYLWADIGAISPPTIRLPKSELIKAVTGAKAEVITQPMKPTVADGTVSDFTKSENVDGTTDLDRQVQQFSSIETPTLVDFQQAFFAGPAIEILGKAVDTFKRGMYNSIFKLRAPVPTIANIATTLEGEVPVKGAVEEYSNFLEGKASMFPAKWNSILTNPDEQAHYIDTVLARNFDFLMSLYFPSVRKGEQGYSFYSSHYKMKSYAEKDSISMLHEGMNEMLLTQLFNTPLITRSGSSWITTKDTAGNSRYISRSDIEEITTDMKDLTTLDEIEDILSRSVSPVTQSIYRRFFSREPIQVDGAPYWAMSSVQNEDAWKIRDALAAFLRTGQIYTLAYVDKALGYRGLPTSVFGRPNIVREQGLESINTTLKGQQISERSTYFYTEKIGRIDKKEAYDDKETIDALKAIGLTWFNENHLNDIKFNEREILGLTDPKQVNKYLIDNVVFKSLRSGKNGNVNFSGDLNVVFRSIARVEGIQSSLDYINLNGDLVYRLRNTTPVFSYQSRINDVARSPESLLAENMAVKGKYKIRSMFVKDGLSSTYKGREKSKSSGKLDTSEQMELDILYGFAHTLKDAYRRTSSYNTAVLPFLVYGDSKTDITPIIESDDFFRNSKGIVNDLFKSQAVYYTRLEREVLATWAQLGVTGNSLDEISKQVSKLDPKDVESTPGMIKNLYYEVRKGKVAIKQELLDTVKFFSREGNNDSYYSKLGEQYDALHKMAKDNGLMEKLTGILDNKTPDDILRSFYYNWIAFNESMRQLTVGAPMQYKGGDPSSEYIDMTKRARGQASTYSASIFRRYDWADRVAKEGMTPELQYEGRKMPRFVKVAYVKDYAKPLLSLAGESKFQEVYDGATFVTPLTRIFQAHAQGGEFGIQTPPVMKNVTVMFNPKNGVNTFIKNAEFELTPEILQNGTDAIRQVAMSMLNEPLVQLQNEQAQGSGDATTALEWLTKNGVAPDLSNIEYEHFEKLAEYLVKTGNQASVIMEVIPNTSAKTGQGAINDMVPTAGRYTAEVMDLATKGTQLDASHEPYGDMYTTLPSQLINAISMNWKEPEMIQGVHNALASIARKVSGDLKNLTPQAFKDKLKSIVRSSIESKQNISYAHSLVREDFPIDDRQIIGMVFPNLNADLSDQAISFPVRGGQYVVHPADNLVQVYDVPVDVEGTQVIKTLMRNQAPKEAIGRDLRWKSPVRADGVTLDQLVLEVHEQVTGQSNPAAITAAYASKPSLKEKRDKLMAPIRKSLDSDEWTAGEAEIILPAEMRDDFGIEPGTALADVTPEYFAKIIPKLNPKIDKELVPLQAQVMFNSFQKRLEGNMIRIPTTAMHSSVRTKVVGFMDGSLNSVFSPSMMLFIQGADQDIDKGNYLTYEVFKGKIPVVTPGTKLRVAPSISPEEEEEIQEVPTHEMELQNPELYTPADREKAWLVGMKNYIVQNINTIVSSPKNAYHSNVSVDEALQILKDMRDERLATSQPFSWDSYLDFTRMHEQAQVAKSLVGIFANSLKAYQILYALYKSNGVNDNSVMADLGEANGTETWIKLAGLINSATDDLKEQILGPLGINDMNANIVSYLVTRGWELPMIIKFLDANKTDLDILKSYKRYDSHRAFKPEIAWKDNPRLIQVYRLGEEYSTIAQSIMNRAIPSSAYDMFAYGNRIERFTNESFKRAGVDVRLNFDRFLEDDAYANNMIAWYKSLVKRGPNKEIMGNHAYNLLAVLKRSPHVSAYINLYKTSKDLVNGASRIIPAVNKLASEVSHGDGDDSNLVSDRNYRDMMDFTYGLAIDKYFKAHKIEYNGIPLYTPEGRTTFTGWVGTTGLQMLKAKYPSNPFVNSLSYSVVERYNYTPASVVRTFDLMNMTEERMLELRVGLEQLSEEDRQMLVNYSRIINRGAMGKGSFSQLFNVADMRPFNDFMSSLDSLDASRNEYDRFNNGIAGLAFNAIPYGSQQDNNQTIRTTATVEKKNEVPHIYSHPDEKDEAGYVAYVNSLASEEDIEEFLDEIPEGMSEPIHKKLSQIASRKLRIVKGQPLNTSSETNTSRKAGTKKFAAIMSTLKLGNENATHGKLPLNYYKAAIVDINSMFSFNKLAELRSMIWEGLKNLNNETKWNLTNKIQARFDELNNGKFNKDYKERQQDKNTSTLNFEALNQLISSIEPNQKGTLSKDLFLDIKRSLDYLGEGQREEIFKLMERIPELNPAVVRQLKRTDLRTHGMKVSSVNPAPFEMAKPDYNNPGIPNNVVSYLNRVAKTEIPQGVRFDDEANLFYFKGHKLSLGSSYIDFIKSLQSSRKVNKADKAGLSDIVAYYEAIRNRKNPTSDVIERIHTCQ